MKHTVIFIWVYNWNVKISNTTLLQKLTNNWMHFYALFNEHCWCSRPICVKSRRYYSLRRHRCHWSWSFEINNISILKILNMSQHLKFKCNYVFWIYSYSLQRCFINIGGCNEYALTSNSDHWKYIWFIGLFVQIHNFWKMLIMLIICTHKW